MKPFSNGSICEDELVARFQLWERVILAKETGYVFLYPFTEHTRHAHFFSIWYSSRHKTAPKIVSVLTMTGETSDFNLTDEDMANGLIVDSAELLLKPDTVRLFHTLVNKARLNDVPIIFLIEMMPFEYLEYVERFNNTAYYKNLISYPLYDKKNIMNFIGYIENEWKFKIPKSTKELLFEETGGYLFLVKEIVRQIRGENKTLSEVITSEAYIYRMEKIWNALPAAVHELSSQQYKGGITARSSASTHLFATNFFNKECNGSMPSFLKRLVKGHLATKIEINHRHICINGGDVSSAFSPYEKQILTVLVENKSTIVSRDDLAKARWGEKWTELYSDWALDQAMYRIRNKLKNIDKTILISSQRNKGYAITL